MKLALVLLFAVILKAQSITGKIVDPIPLPLQNVPVGLLPVGGDWVAKSTRTDANGTFRFTTVEPGEYVLVLRANGFRGQVRVVHVSDDVIDVGTLAPNFFSGCESPIGNCNTVGTPSWPEAPVVDLCEALKAPERYGSRLIVMVGALTTLHGWPTLTATCNYALSSGGLTWANAVLLPEGAAPQASPTLPNIPDLKKKLADRAAVVRKAGSSTKSKIVAVYGFLDVPDGLTAVPCAGSCARPDILMPPASFLRVDGFQELR